VTVRKRDDVHQLAVPVSEEDWIRGPDEAPVTIVEYGDYQCPFCQRAHGDIERLLAAQAGHVRFVFRHFPLMSAHPQAMAAAVAAEAAGRQGSFWQMHAKLFGSHGHLDDQRIREYAADLELDLDKFARDVESEEIESHIRRQRLAGARSGVNGTPTFFVNGLRYDGDPTYGGLSAAVTTARRQAARGEG
jgi:protein-disulfide isomerase